MIRRNSNILKQGRRELLKKVALISVLGSYTDATKSAQILRDVIALDWAIAQTMLALGAPPMAIIGAADWARFVVEPKLPIEVADLGLQQEISFERIAKLKPKIILTSPFTQNLEHILERIAPCKRLSVFEANKEPLGHAKILTTQIAQTIGEMSAANQYIEMVEHRLNTIKNNIQSQQQKKVVLVNFLDSRHARVYGGNGLYQNVLKYLGLKNAWEGNTNYWGFTTIGVERLATLGDVRVIVFGDTPRNAIHTLENSPIWNSIEFVRNQQVHFLPAVLMFGGLPSALRCANLLENELIHRI